MRSTLLLLLVSLGLAAAAAPTPPPATTRPHYQEEARAFFGKVANLLAKHQFVDLYDLVAAKAEDLVPGIVGDRRSCGPSRDVSPSTLSLLTRERRHLQSSCGSQLLGQKVRYEDVDQYLLDMQVMAQGEVPTTEFYMETDSPASRIFDRQSQMKPLQSQLVLLLHVHKCVMRATAAETTAQVFVSTNQQYLLKRQDESTQQFAQLNAAFTHQEIRSEEINQNVLKQQDAKDAMVQHLIRLQNETAQKNRRNEEIMQQLIASIFKLQSAFDQQTIRNEKQALKLQDENARLAALVNAHEKKLPARPEHFAAEDREKKDSNDLASDDENNHRHSTSDIHNDNSAHSDLDAINSDGGEPGEAQAEKG
ncbi:hypothetical protein PRIPAC_94496, partial [Pristionchus pacificus]|uniref:Uncharacterized protein n=1 Tax=Pristionchus pacificus TaxID=54126 RepID=A0A2A6CDL0_PRIPA